MSEKKSGSPSQFPLDILHVLQTHLRSWVHRTEFTQKQNRAEKKKNYFHDFCSIKSSLHTVATNERLCFGREFDRAVCRSWPVSDFISTFSLSLPRALKSTSQTAQERNWGLKLAVVSSFFWWGIINVFINYTFAVQFIGENNEP